MLYRSEEDAFGKIVDERGEVMEKISTREAVKRLGINRMTFERWILQKKVKVYRKNVGGESGRSYKEFDAHEIADLKSKMVNNWIRGKSYFKKEDSK